MGFSIGYSFSTPMVSRPISTYKGLLEPLSTHYFTLVHYVRDKFLQTTFKPVQLYNPDVCQRGVRLIALGVGSVAFFVSELRPFS